MLTNGNSSVTCVNKYSNGASVLRNQGTSAFKEYLLM